MRTALTNARGSVVDGDLHAPARSETLPKPPMRTNAIVTVGDRVGDALWLRGDLTAAGVGSSAAGITAASVAVSLYDSPYSLSWEYGLTGPVWFFDVNGDGKEEYAAAMLNVGGSVSAGVLNAAGTLVCNAVPYADPATRQYGVGFSTSCIGNPASYRWWVGMLYDDFITGTDSFDAAPDSGWAGPVANDAFVPPATVPPVTAPPVTSPPVTAPPVTTPPVTAPPVTAPPVASGGPAPTNGAQSFTAVGPERLFDTRFGSGLRTVGATKVGGAYVLGVQVTDLAGLVPATGVSAVSMNVAATGADGDGFVTVFPCGARREVASVNYSRGQTVSNAVVAPVSPDGRVCFYSLAPVDIIVDINGWFATT